MRNALLYVAKIAVHTIADILVFWVKLLAWFLSFGQVRNLRDPKRD